jgi:uncharacterized protein YaeQ
MNRRRSTRIMVRLECYVVWPHGRRTVMLTENISRDGMLLRWDSATLPVPKTGDMLILEVELPEQQGFERRCIRCQATVVWRKQDEGAEFAWVGLQVHAMDFRVAQVSGSPVEDSGYGRGRSAL